MKRLRTAICFLILILGLAGIAHADLDGFLRRVNEQAKSDINRFAANVSARFGIPVPRVEDVLKHVPTPADAFMVFQLSEMSRNQPDMVLHTYQAGRDKGWGAIAHELGIKPGSPEFHALKRGDLHLSGESAVASGHGQGTGRGKGRGKGRNTD